MTVQLLRLSLVVVLLLVVPAAPSLAASTDWTPLGALGPFGVSALAIAPSSTTDKTIVAQRGPDIIVSSDGGGQWQRHGAPPSARHADLNFASAGVLLATTDENIYRSTDLGQTWAPGPGISRPALHVSPASSTVFALDDQGGLWRSLDTAQSWQAVQPAEGQFVQSVGLSPDFAVDHTIVTAVAGGRRFAAGVVYTDFPLADADSSSGVMLSTDGGDTWQQRADGLAIDGQPYLAVQNVAVSPTFGQDNTLLAIAYGDPQPSVQFGQSVTALKRALFRSTDRGTTWQALDSDGPYNFATHTELALSPNFAADGIALWARNYSAGTPASGSCKILRSADAGTTWTEVLATTAPYSGCASLELLQAPGRVVAHAQVSNPTNQQWSDDAGQTWSAFPLSPSPLVFATAGSTIFVGFQPFDGSGGLFALGPNLTPSTAALSCSESLAGGFARVMAEHPEARNLLGCPLEAEHNAQIQAWADKVGPGSLLLWPDDGSIDPVVLFPFPWSYSGSYRGAAFTVVPKDHPTPDAVVPGAVQRFEAAGAFIFTRGLNASSNTIYVVSGNRVWTDFLDPP